MLILVGALAACSSESEPTRSIAETPPGRPPAPDRMVYAVFLDQGFTIVVTDSTGKASLADPIYIASSATDWDPAHPDARMTRRSDGAWQKHFPMQDPGGTPFEFKFTRGSWETVETDADGNDVRNRRPPIIMKVRVEDGRVPELKHEIAGWKDGGEGEPPSPDA